MKSGQMRLAAVGAVSAVILSAAPAVAKPGPQLELVVDSIDFRTIDLGAPGKSPGDRYAVNGAVRDRSGTQVGTFRAIQSAIAIEGGAETVQTEGVFALADGTIAFAGVARAPRQGPGLTGHGFRRAVIGGTGRYAGASGTIVTRRRAEGVYDQRLRLVLPDGPPTTLQIPAAEGPADEHVALTPPGTNPGDLVAIHGTLADPPGGTARGTHSVLAVEGNDELVLSSFTFGLPNGDLSVLGLGKIPVDGTTLVPGEPFERAVTGGTRAFAGRGGTQTVVRNAEGGYANELRLWRPAGGKPRRLRLTSKNPSGTTLDLGAPGPSVGDIRVFRAPSVNTKGKRVGRVVGTRTTVSTTGGQVTVETLLTFELRHGTIVAGGVSASPSSEPIVHAVLGGTGRYAGMRGTLRAFERPDGFVDRLRLRRVG